MRDLTPDAAALLRAGQTALRPDASARARVLESLTRTLGEGAFVDGPHDVPSSGGATAARFFGRTSKLLGGFSVLAVGAGISVAAYLWTPAHLRAAPAAVSGLPTEPAAPAPIALSAEDEPTPALPRLDHAPSAPRSHSRIASGPTSDSLAEEVRLLSRAERQLSDGLGEDALRTLGEHERRFPKGALAEERMAARVEALCAVGRRDEAKTDLTRLARAYPKSPHLDGARRFCGVDRVATPRALP